MNLRDQFLPLVWKVPIDFSSTVTDLLVLKISSVGSIEVQLLMTTTLQVPMLSGMLEAVPSRKALISLLRFLRRIDDSEYQSIIWIRSLSPDC